MNSVLTYQHAPLEALRTELNQGKLISLMGAILFHITIVMFLLSSWTSSMPKPSETKSIQVQMFQLPKPVIPPPVIATPEPKVIEPVKQVQKPKPKPIEKKEFAFKRVDKPKVEPKPKVAPKPKPKKKQPEPNKTVEPVKQSLQAEPIPTPARTKPVETVASSSSDKAPQMTSAPTTEKSFDVTQYRPVEKQPPAYPRKALRKGIEGDCTVQYSVNTSGHVESPKVVGPCHPSFVKPSLEAAKTFRYAPRLVNGKAVPVPNVRNTFEYRLN